MTTEWSSADPAFLAAYGQVVSALRTQKGLDRKALAEIADISYSYLSAIESGQRFPSGTVQEALAQALDVDPSTMLANANGALADPEPDGASDRFESSQRLAALHVPLGAASDVARRQQPPPRDFEPSASGTAAEIAALLDRMSGEDRATLLALARRLSGGPAERSPRSGERERRYRGQSGRGLRTAAYLDFWTMYVRELEARGLDWAAGRRPEPRSYFTTPSPIRGASLSASFARNRLLRHELYINRGSRDANLELLAELEHHRAEFERAYGGPLEFEDPGRERRAVRIAEYRPGHISRVEEYQDYVEWFITRGERMRSAIGVVPGIG